MTTQNNSEVLNCESVLPVTQGIQPTHCKHHQASKNRQMSQLPKLKEFHWDENESDQAM